MYVFSLNVLRTATGSPLREGMRLYAALQAADAQVAVVGDEPLEEIQRWMRQNRVRADEVLGSESGIADEDLRVYQVRLLRARGAHIDSLFEPDPYRAFPILAEGVTVCVFSHPTWARPDRRWSRSRAMAWNRITSMLNQRQGMADEEV